MFGRATIRLGIGPHSSLKRFDQYWQHQDIIYDFQRKFKELEVLVKFYEYCSILGDRLSCLSCLSVCPSVRLSVCLPVCLSVCLSVCL